MPSKERDKQNHMPPFPAGWTDRFTGPAYVNGMTADQARAVWQGFLRKHRSIRPCPSQRFVGGVDSRKS